MAEESMAPLGFSTLLMRYVLTDNLNGAKRLLNGVDEHDRKLIVAKGQEGNAPLFIAAKRGNVDIVKFLVNECHANVEERGEYEVEEDKSRHLVTPLWCAAVADRLEVVKLLAELGADINAASDTGSTPVRSACYMSNIEVVKFLVLHGADIEKPNINGGTCLINAVQSVELCQFLIDNGAKVNAQDSSGNLALHYAIKEGRYDTVQLLVAQGSDPYIKNEFGDDALQTASLRGHQLIMDELLTKLNPDVSRWIESYQLLGGNYVDERQDVETALIQWRTAVQMRVMNSVEFKALEPKPAYLFIQEVNSVEELEALGQNRDMVYMYALMIRERILGLDHKDTIFGLMYRGAVYADIREYRRCIDLWKYAFQLRHNRVELLTSEYLFTLQALCKLFWEVYEECHQPGGQTNCIIEFRDVFEVLEMTTSEVELAEGFKCSDEYPDEEALLLSFLQLVLQLVNLITKLDKTADQILCFKRVVHRLVRSRTKTQNGRTFLHLSVDRTTSRISEEFYSRFPSPSVVEVLLECGANVNSVDVENNTALHLCTDALPNLRDVYQEEMKKVIALLLQNSAHVDIVNSSGDIAAKRLKINILNFLSLKCLAANTVRKYQIPYVGRVPVTVESFIQMHGTRASSKFGVGLVPDITITGYP